MAVTKQEFSTTITSFLDLIEQESDILTGNERELSNLLDNLAVLYHRLTAYSKEYSPSDTPRRDQNALRKLITRRFPSFGRYQVSSSVTATPTPAIIEIGDSIDDILDITNELYSVNWLLLHNGIEEAAEYFVVSYDIHWGEHLRTLQLYIYCIKRGL
ncbi:MAG: hypothetical protein SGI97_01180 [candidate division Zixibacteria bacterium]|nr:hypothetical protein [candidate division Zixibacteria bacterium]